MLSIEEEIFKEEDGEIQNKKQNTSCDSGTTEINRILMDKGMNQEDLISHIELSKTKEEPLKINNSKKDSKALFKFVNSSVIKEWLFFILIALVLSLVTLIYFPLGIDNSYIEISSLKIAFNKTLLIHSSYLSFALIIIFNIIIYFIRGFLQKGKFAKVSHIVYFIIFDLLGAVAFMLMPQIMVVEKYRLSWNPILSLYLSSAITLIYTFIIYKLYLEQFIDDKRLPYEIVRFSLVGLVASLVDYVGTSITRGLLNLVVKNEVFVTFVAVSVGFTFGVIVNYILSITMVYKKNIASKYNKIVERVLFVILSLVGLGIGFGFEALFYNDNIIKLNPYILCFVLRTLIVMTYNYLSRKFILFRTEKAKK